MNTSRTPRSSRSAHSARAASVAASGPSIQRPTGAAGSPKQARSAKAAAQGGAATAAGGSAPGAHGADGVRVLKKYPNRRLYDTASSSYITLAEVKGLVMRAEPFVVRDAKTGEDLTRSILLQIILEEEAGGSPLLSEAVLCQLIRFYGHAMQGFFGAHLAAQIQAFAEMQQKMMAAAPAVGAENWPKAFDNWPANAANWQEMMSRCMPFASPVAPMPPMPAMPSGQAWQQAQEQMQEQMQRQFQAGLQGWMAAFQPQAAAPSDAQPAPEPPPPAAKSSRKQRR